MINEELYDFHYGECGRVYAYDKETQKIVSWPRILMEDYLGRKLDENEEVHHIDKDPSNNSIENLMVMTRSDHRRYHAQKYEDIITTCAWCGEEFLWTASQQMTHHGGRNKRSKYSADLDRPFCSRKCSGEYGSYIQNEYYAENHDNSSSRRKLNNDDVRFIRENYIPYDKKYGVRALARQFNVDKSVVELVLKGKTYKNV